MLFDNFVLALINLIHFLVILFVIIVPFTNYTFLLLIHSIIVPFIMIHWLLNNDTCAITEAERFVRIKLNGGNPVNYNECFSYKLVSPVYNFISDNPDYSKMTWGITATLWLVSLYKLNNRKQNLQKIFNL
jgi:hypothetical protein